MRMRLYPVDLAEEAIIQAEKYKAKIDNPKGKPAINKIDSLEIKGVIDDDEFIQVSCHVDEGLEDQVGKGQFVELAKLRAKGPQ